MKVLGIYGKEDLAKVYVASMRDGSHLIEFVESLQPPVPREEKWVLIVSSLFGCPVGCAMCDANASGKYLDKLTEDEILAQVDHMVLPRFPDRRVPIPKFKIQFARMGEPSMNDDVLHVLEMLPSYYDAPGMMPCLSTIAPKGRDGFFDRLIEIKNKHYSGGNFQLQFSIHSTAEESRDVMIPHRKWTLREIADYGERWFEAGDRKITLNFAAALEHPVDADVVANIFDPSKFFIKLTPLNPTDAVTNSGLHSLVGIENMKEADTLINYLKDKGFDVLLSIGEPEENRIGSNCGQFVTRVRSGQIGIGENYETDGYKIT